MWQKGKRVEPTDINPSSLLHIVFGNRYLSHLSYPHLPYFLGNDNTTPHNPHFMAFNAATGVMTELKNLTSPQYGQQTFGFAGVEVPIAFFEECIDLP